jgi:tetratricopeptide (TPR) repeat protein
MWFFRRHGLSAAGALIAGACSTAPAQSIYARALGPSYERGVVYSDFLAARFSTLTGEHQAAAHYFRRAALDDPEDAGALDRAVVSSMLALQRFEAADLAGDAPAATLARAPFSRMVLAAEAIGRGDRRQARASLAVGGEGPLNEDIAAVLRGWLAPGSIPSAMPASIRAADRELITAMRAALDGRPVELYGLVDETDLSARPAWVAALRARMMSVSRDPVQAQRLLEAQLATALQPMHAAAALQRIASGKGSLPAHEAIAASVWLLADEALPDGGPELRIFYAMLALSIDPEFEPALFALADALVKMDRRPEALVHLGAIAPGSPYFADAVLTLAEIEIGANDAGAAARSLSEVAWRDQRRDLRLRAGDVLRRLERAEEAEALYAGVLEEDASRAVSDWRPLVARADVLRRLGRWREAEVDLERALGIAPDQPLVLNDLGFAWAERGENLTEALGLLQRAAARQPEDPSILDSLGWVHARMGDIAIAVEFLERAAALAPDRADIMDHLGDVYWRLGRRIEAEYEWRRALALQPAAQLADSIRGKLSNGLPEAAPASAARSGAVTPAQGAGPPSPSHPVQ